MFADLAGFTALTEAHGDEQAADLAGEFCGSVRELLPEYHATDVKAIGDALMARGEDAGRAVELGLRIVREVGSQHGFPSVRVGMHTGPAVERAGDWFGATVNLAARVSGAASGGEVLVTAATRSACGEIAGVDLRPHGRRQFRNVTEPVELFAAVLTGVEAGAALPTDPVCRMAVDHSQCAGELRHDGRTFHFCSLECASTFAAAPNRYAESQP